MGMPTGLGPLKCWSAALHGYFVGTRDLSLTNVFCIVDDGIVGMLLDLSFNRKGGDL
jgi:hypothetical protein